MVYRKENKMKRTYVDLVGEYYDNLDQVHEVASAYGIAESDFRKVFYAKKPKRKQKL